MKLVVIESPGKIKKFTSFLPKDYKIVASVGHITEIPRIGLNIKTSDGSFRPVIQIQKEKAEVVADIVEAAAEADEVYICTDPDREGERIAFDIGAVIGDKAPFKRASFNEITKKAVVKALSKPKEIDMNLVNSQVARSILDRLIGYLVSPKLWDNVGSGTSAGRVQSVALQLILDREKEISAFDCKDFWHIKANFNGFSASLKTGDRDNRLHDKESVEKVLKATKGHDFVIKKVEKKKKSKSPYAPFDTSSLQQAAASAFGWPGSKTMEIAQKIYESGLCTYHRTDSFAISEEAIQICRTHILSEYGDKYLPAKPRVFKKKTASQGAHECIRPTELSRDGGWVDSDELDEDETKLFELIQKRFVACQMASAEQSKTEVILDCNGHEFIAEGQQTVFDGWTFVWPTKESKEVLPALEVDEVHTPKKLASTKHSTRPPDRFNDASLVKRMEKEGVGRPSTWANIVETLLKREYVERDGKCFVVTSKGERVCNYLKSEFDSFFMDIKFTGKVENALDKIETGELDKLHVIKSFYSKLHEILHKEERDKEQAIFG
jgi:DNA topoisomerase-1